ncbi:4Fe-4S binding protein [Dehalobacter sp. DCM]|uniref:4Fe-4S binding protein n=1 Tax=Dehalobacter sp. DCM TaxID=2907827 RepID=UPI0030815896|nr:4Fe-4S binding protein [Dehalobacter sp. DCM]
MSTNNERYGLLIDYDFCTGCHTCETACKVEHKLTHGQWGIKLSQDGPRKLENGRYEFTYVPIPTSLCDLCEDLVKAGKFPTCVAHCQADVMSYGLVKDLAKKMAAKPKMVLFAPK